MVKHQETAEVISLIAKFNAIKAGIQPVPQSNSEAIVLRKGPLTRGQPINRVTDLLRGSWFGLAVGYFLNHRKSSVYAHLDDEYKIQDMVFCLLSTEVPDLQYEDPQHKNVGALSSTRVDFRSEKYKMFVEVKLATGTHNAKDVEAEIHEDIVKYGRQRHFDHLVFFVYCFDYAFPNKNEFERGLTSENQIAGHKFQTYCIVQP